MEGHHLDTNKSDLRLDNRSKRFNVSYDHENIKNKRENQEIELRKTKRADIALKKRNLDDSEREWVKTDKEFSKSYNLNDLPMLVEAMKSNDDKGILMAAQGFRKLLSLNMNPPIQGIIDAGAVPYLINWLYRKNFPQLQYEAAWALTNIASGNCDQTQAVIDRGALPLIIELLKSPVDDVQEQAIWALGNMGGEVEFRELILNLRGMDCLLECVEKATKPSMVKQGIWALSNLCRGKPKPEYEFVKAAVPFMAKGLAMEDTEIINDVL